MNLVAFGCSSTYGQGLSDCFKSLTAAGPHPSEFAWPSQLANLLEINCINQSLPGSSNLSILNRILNYRFEQTDIVFVMWSFYARDLIYNEDGYNTNLIATDSSTLAKCWLTTHNNYDLMMKSWLYTHHAYSYFKSKNLRFVFLKNKVEEDFLNVMPEWASHITFSKYSIYDFSIENSYPLARDSRHPGPKCHLEFAKALHNELLVS